MKRAAFARLAFDARCAPPSVETSRLQMASPKPVPPKRRVDEQSACVNALKISRWCCRRDADASVADGESGFARARRRVDSASARRRQPRPACVNLMALPTRFTSTCRSRTDRHQACRRVVGKCDRPVPVSFRVLAGASDLTVSPKLSPDRSRWHPARACPPRFSKSRECR